MSNDNLSRIMYNVDEFKPIDKPKKIAREFRLEYTERFDNYYRMVKVDTIVTPKEMCEILSELMGGE